MKRHIFILAACACACASAGVMSARFGSLVRNDTVVTNVTDVVPGNYEAVSNAAMSAATHATNYTDAVAAEFENGTREVDYASDANTAFYLAGDDDTYNATDLIRESTNAAISVSAGKQEALPYPTNAIPYAAISGGPSGGGQEWRVDNQSSYEIHYVTNGMANVQMGAELSCNTNGWCDGAAMFARFTIDAGISYMVMDDRIRLVGYGAWPTNNFQSVWWRSGQTIYVNILLEE